jgi:hypothetical protein
MALAFLMGCASQQGGSAAAGVEATPAHIDNEIISEPAAEPGQKISEPAAEPGQNQTAPEPNVTGMEQPLPPVHAESDVEFLIISSSDLMETAYKLDERRDAEGLATYVKNVSELDANNSWDVAGWVYWYRMSHPKVKYLLLLGDVDSIPTFNYTDDEVDYQIEGDYDYSFPKDDIPTIAVGRIPARNGTEAERWMDKLVAYEDQPPARSVLLFGFSGEYDAYAEPHERALESSGFQVYLLNGSSAAQVSERLNSGVGFAVFYGHGTAYAMLPVFASSDIRRLDNKDKPVILLSGGCDTQGYAGRDQAISELFVTDENGAVAAIGATRRGGFGYLYEFVPFFFEECGNGRLGDAFDGAEKSMYNDWIASTLPHIHGDKYEEARQFMERFVILGDPTTRICQS